MKKCYLSKKYQIINSHKLECVGLSEQNGRLQSVLKCLKCHQINFITHFEKSICAIKID
jgi:hypothetical protein